MKKKLKKICDVKDCKNKATEKMGQSIICNDCFVKVAYDMQPLILKK